MDFKDTLFYSEEYVYMSKELFNSVLMAIPKTIKVNALKYGLLKSGILAANNCTTRCYEAKMYYYTEMGQRKDIRMYRFVRSKLAPVGEDFIENFEYI